MEEKRFFKRGDFFMAIKWEKKVQKAIFVPWGWIFCSAQEDGFGEDLSLLSGDPLILAVEMKHDVPLWDLH